MRTELNPGTAIAQSTSPINAVVRTESTGTQRRVVARSASNGGGTARRATNTTTTARAATVSNASTGTSATQSRRVVARSATNGGGIVRSATTARTIRGDASNIGGSRGDTSYLARISETAANQTQSTTESIPSARCLADYTDCMNQYCVRENTAYNRCYCSSKLSQIDSKYQNAIDNLIKQIIQLQNKSYWSDAEMNEYWMSTVGKYSGENSWTNLDNALNIDWASTESRVRGQQAFATGHEYCVQHLRGCTYMASNMRDAYRSEISRDCATYENALQTIKNVAESLVESYQ
ncbi:MAG: hypothetical protein NC311_05415 [Muribaculaceae bacterium]|nr:hypothetical protein [Muribaculaceae bacterium]